MRINNYATDGRNVFYRAIPIHAASVKSFSVMDYEWARDTSVLFHNGKLVPNANPDDIRFVTPSLLVSNNRVFDVSHKGVIERPDMDASLRRLSSSCVTDRNHIYRAGKQIATVEDLLTEGVGMPAVCATPERGR
ncbi:MULTISPECIES: DKNYY domain-containing protein [Pseudomonas]|uniref:DKNYY domain-containing protein n=1 Tax=Pseudomonas TaxID=286 RepID=UPI00236201A1|nr:MULTISPECIES: DKNYY domain-containing protein [Pseudomonas]WJV25552.1 DKNYY domain-containing protein [Pseudomonas chlororaphis]